MTEFDAQAASDRSDLAPVERLLHVVSALRGEGGCPWDREQTLISLKPYLVEEAYELLDAIDDDDPDGHREELGDVLLQVVLQSQIRAESGEFTFEDVAGTLCDKLVRRHPHVFGEASAQSSAEVVQRWEAIKRQERVAQNVEPSVLSGVPRALPALQRAQRIQSRAARVGFDWTDRKDVLAKIAEELGELQHAIEDAHPDDAKEEMGDLLFAIVNFCRHLGLDAEEALSQTNAKFIDRFAFIEHSLRNQGRRIEDVGLDVMDALWDESKHRGREAE